MPPAARVTDMHTCAMVTGVVPHVGGPILPPCCPTVLIGGLPAARVTDLLTCVGPPDMIAKGSPTVMIGGLPAARMGDLTAHGGVIVLGMPTVMIGDAPSGAAAPPVTPPAPSAAQMSAAQSSAAATVNTNPQGAMTGAAAEAEKIGNGHAYGKHGHEFGNVSKDEFKKLIGDTIQNGQPKTLARGRSAHWSDKNGMVVIKDPASPDGGTAFRPVNGKAYFDNLK